jgi:alkylated DNA repair dioxygenase AlkB
MIASTNTQRSNTTMAATRKAVSMTLPIEQIDYIDQIAEDNLLSRSSAAAMIINQYRLKMTMHTEKNEEGEEA